MTHNCLPGFFSLLQRIIKISLIKMIPYHNICDYLSVQIIKSYWNVDHIIIGSFLSCFWNMPIIILCLSAKLKLQRAKKRIRQYQLPQWLRRGSLPKACMILLGLEKTIQINRCFLLVLVCLCSVLGQWSTVFPCKIEAVCRKISKNQHWQGGNPLFIQI